MSGEVIPELFHSGEVIADKYRIERTLGSGGMSAVFSALHVGLEQRVALKVLLPSLLAKERFVARFLQEARAAARIRGDHVGRVLDVGTTQTGLPFIALELLEGVDLGEYLERCGPPPVGDAVDLVLQACDGIARAHAVGIIHRDIKPSNLFLTSKDGRHCVKVIDFGISKVTNENDDRSLTQTAESLGSPQYMSPEQIRAAKDIDLRTDIWSLGCVLFELLTNSAPFEGASVFMLGSVIMNDPPRDLRAARPEVPPELEAIVLRCLEKEPARRFATVVDLAAALAPFARADGDLIDSMRRLDLAVTTGPFPVSASSGRYPLPPSSSGGIGAVAAMTRTAPVPARDTQADPRPAAPLPLGKIGIIAGVFFAVSVVGVITILRLAGGHGHTPTGTSVASATPPTAGEVPSSSAAAPVPPVIASEATPPVPNTAPSAAASASPSTSAPSPPSPPSPRFASSPPRRSPPAKAATTTAPLPTPPSSPAPRPTSGVRDRHGGD